MKTPMPNVNDRPAWSQAPIRLLAASLLLPTLAAAAATEAEPDATALYDANCTKCHSSEVYTRDDRRIQSLDKLEGQVQQCETALELRWFDDQVMAVTRLLNDQYYHFKP